MKRFLMCALAVLMLAGCADTIGTGYRGVQLQWNKPTGTVYNEGLQFYAPFSGISIANMNVQQQTDTLDTSVQSKDGQRIDVSAAVMYQLNPSKVVSIYDSLLNDYQSRVIDPTLRSAIRQAIGNYPYTDVVAHQNEVLQKIDRDLRTAVEPYGIEIVNVYLTKVAFDPSVQQAIEAKVAAQLAADKAVLEAKGAAAAQQLQHQSLTPALLQKMAIDKWDGHLPTYVNGSNAPFLSLIEGGKP